MMFDVIIILADMLVWTVLLGGLWLCVRGCHFVGQQRLQLKAAKGTAGYGLLVAGMSLVTAAALTAFIAAAVVEIVHGVRLVILLLALLFAGG